MAMVRTTVTKLIQAGAMVALLAGAASAQGVPISMPLQSDKPALTPEQAAKQKEIDKEYKSAVQKIPEKKPADPWGNIRPDGATASKSNQ